MSQRIQFPTFPEEAPPEVHRCAASLQYMIELTPTGRRPRHQDPVSIESEKCLAVLALVWSYYRQSITDKVAFVHVEQKVLAAIMDAGAGALEELRGFLDWRKNPLGYNRLCDVIRQIARRRTMTSALHITEVAAIHGPEYAARWAQQVYGLADAGEGGGAA